VVNGVVYWSDSINHLYAFNAATGRKIWSLPGINSAEAAPTVGGGMLCVSGTNGTFYAVRASSGTLAWQLSGQINGSYEQSWALDGGRVAVTLGLGDIRMYDAAHGVRLWSGPTGLVEAQGGWIAASGGVVYAVDVDGTLNALNAATGQLMYRTHLFDSPTSVSTNLVISGDTMYLGDDSSSLYAINLATGKLRWTYQLESFFPATDPVIAGGMVYFRDNHATLHAVDASNGKPVWTYPDPEDNAETNPTGAAVVGGYAYITTFLGALQQLNAKTGEPGWGFNPNGQGLFDGTPVAAGGLIFAGSGTSSGASGGPALYAIRLS
jgi:outer membrane protein assembly factor BamB